MWSAAGIREGSTELRMNQTLCQTLVHLSAPCDQCHKRAEPVHVYRIHQQSEEGPRMVTSFYCRDHCPVHGTPLLDDSLPDAA